MTLFLFSLLLLTFFFVFLFLQSQLQIKHIKLLNIINTMKKLIILLMFIPMIGFAQTIKGIGQLHLDMSLQEVQSLFPKKLIKQKSTVKSKKVFKLPSYTPIKEYTFKNLYRDDCDF